MADMTVEEYRASQGLPPLGQQPIYMSAEDFHALWVRSEVVRRHKHNAQKVVLDGITFPSKAEAAHYCELKVRLAAGEITDLVLQPKFTFQPKFTDARGKKIRAITYTADFSYLEPPSTQLVVVEVKGHRTKEWLRNEKFFRYQYPEHDLRVVG